MDQRIIFPNDAGGIAVIIPTGEMPIEEVARKDVPQGVSYRIVNVSDLPADRTFREAWEASFAPAEIDGTGDPAGWTEDRAAEEAAAQVQADADRLAREAAEAAAIAEMTEARAAADAETEAIAAELAARAAEEAERLAAEEEAAASPGVQDEEQSA